MNQRIEQLALVVRDYDEAIQFYTSQLSFRLVEDTVLSDTKRWVLLEPPGTGSCRLLLAKAANEEQVRRVGNQTGGRVFLFLHTDDFDRDYEQMKSKGILFIREPAVETYGKVAVFRDLYGNLWDLIEPKKKESASSYLQSAIQQFNQYKKLAEKAMEQVADEKINWQYNPETNSIATIVKHLAGNMLSRFTDFLTSDGEKSWRNRDGEFENEFLTREKLMDRWNEGWDCLFRALHNLNAEDLSKTVYIRNEKHTVMEAINRQLTHYASHVGQIILIGKMVCDKDWKSLSIPRGNSRDFNAKKGL